MTRNQGLGSVEKITKKANRKRNPNGNGDVIILFHIAKKEVWFPVVVMSRSCPVQISLLEKFSAEQASQKGGFN